VSAVEVAGTRIIRSRISIQQRDWFMARAAQREDLWQAIPPDARLQTRIQPCTEDRAATRLQTTVEIVRKPAEQRGFAMHPKRWVVERSLARLTAHRSQARDYERDPAISEAFIR
jgi:transposase